MKKIIKTIKNDGIGILPTDTLYGVVGSAFSKEAVKRIYKIKGRDENKPFIILISSISELAKFGIKLNSYQIEFLNNAWPNPISVILPCISSKFEYLHRGTKSLAFRFPKSKKLQLILQKTGPLVAPSANLQGKKPAETIFQAKKYFGDSVDFYISNGKKIGKASTILKLNKDNYSILREGTKKI